MFQRNEIANKGWNRFIIPVVEQESLKNELGLMLVQIRYPPDLHPSGKLEDRGKVDGGSLHHIDDKPWIGELDK